MKTVSVTLALHLDVPEIDGAIEDVEYTLLGLHDWRAIERLLPDGTSRLAASAGRE